MRDKKTIEFLFPDIIFELKDKPNMLRSQKSSFRLISKAKEMVVIKILDNVSLLLSWSFLQRYWNSNDLKLSGLNAQCNLINLNDFWEILSLELSILVVNF